MPVCYMGHPIGALTKEGVAANVARAKRWLRFLQRTFPERAFIAPYLDWIEVCGDDDEKPEERERALLRDCAVVARCDEFWPVGCSDGGMTKGMTRELGASGRINGDSGALMPSQGIVVFGHYLSFVEPPETGKQSKCANGRTVTAAGNPMAEELRQLCCRPSTTTICRKPIAHIETFYGKLRGWCEEHTPWSGHHEEHTLWFDACRRYREALGDPRKGCLAKIAIGALCANGCGAMPGERHTLICCATSGVCTHGEDSWPTRSARWDHGTHREPDQPSGVSVTDAADGGREDAAGATQFVEHRYACGETVGSLMLQHITSIWLPNGVPPPSYVACSIGSQCGLARKEYYRGA